MAVDLELAGLDLRDVEQALDQPGQMLAAALDRPRRVLDERWSPILVVLEQLGIAEDRVERRPQLVADARRCSGSWPVLADSAFSLARCNCRVGLVDGRRFPAISKLGLAAATSSCGEVRLSWAGRTARTTMPVMIRTNDEQFGQRHRERRLGIDPSTGALEVESARTPCRDDADQENHQRDSARGGIDEPAMRRRLWHVALAENCAAARQARSVLQRSPQRASSEQHSEQIGPE